MLTIQDVKESDYYYEAIKIAKQLRIAQGNNRLFSPKSPITRQDMAVLTIRALEVNKLIELPNENDKLVRFKDSNSISKYAEQAMNKLVQLELIKGNEGKISPLDALTRAELAVFLHRLYNL